MHQLKKLYIDGSDGSETTVVICATQLVKPSLGKSRVDESLIGLNVVQQGVGDGPNRRGGNHRFQSYFLSVVLLPLAYLRYGTTTYSSKTRRGSTD